VARKGRAREGVQCEGGKAGENARQGRMEGWGRGRSGEKAGQTWRQGTGEGNYRV
jgi:hypothetical protein